ncbi:MAG: DUF3604 domain-containing protein [Paracoccaceae bacterium]
MTYKNTPTSEAAAEEDSIGGRVSDALMGEVWPDAQPGEDPVLYGHAHLDPAGPVEVRSLQTFRLTYTAGRYGLDDTGSIRVVFRAMSDAQPLQTANPAAPNYVSAHTSTGVPLNVEYRHRGISARPRWKALTITVAGGCLREGDQIVVVFGDTSAGSPGIRMQTMADGAFEFKVLADVCAVGQFVPICDSPSVAVVPGPPVIWKAVLPTLRRPGERFRFGVKAEDHWGNPTDLAQAKLRFETTMAVKGLPATFDYGPGKKSVAFDDLTISEPGTLTVTVFDVGGTELARSNPLIIREGAHGGYWADMHGQSGESIGLTTARQYFDFARNKAFLDATSHQANDFQINNAFWDFVNELCAENNEDGVFVTLPGYEWSGNTAVGGDRNVYFRTEGRQIHRSSHALLSDRSDINTDAPNANLLFDALKNEDCVIYAHVGGRYADIAYAHDPKLETAMEIHSAWGTFEWLLTDGFPLGHRCGVVCNSDGHKGRPGASYPGAATFGAYGGLTCFLSDDLTRDGLFECLKRRHHYGTTGNRLHMEVHASFDGGGKLYERDPRAWPDSQPRDVAEVMMGDIVQTGAETARLRFQLASGTPIERVEVRNGTEVVATVRPYAPEELGSRIRVIWSGAEYRGRGRATPWKGRVRFPGAQILSMEKINSWNHERLLELAGGDTVVFDTITTGNFGGFDVWLDESAAARIAIDCNRCALNEALADVGYDATTVDLGGLYRELRVIRLPDDNCHLSMAGEVEIPLAPIGDNPLWISAYTEDGFQAWSSPIFAYRSEK